MKTLKAKTDIYCCINCKRNYETPEEAEDCKKSHNLKTAFSSD